MPKVRDLAVDALDYICTYLVGIVAYSGLMYG